MVRELARDRDDYRRMAEAYREDLARLERSWRASRRPRGGTDGPDARSNGLDDAVVADDLDEEQDETISDGTEGEEA